MRTPLVVTVVVASLAFIGCSSDDSSNPDAAGSDAGALDGTTANDGTMTNDGVAPTDPADAGDGAVSTELPLDPTGATIPDTNYPIPTGAIYMSPTGNDTNDGSAGSPVLTLEKAIALAPANGTIVVHGGTYRDGATTVVNKTVTIQAYPHEQAWFDGTDVLASSKFASDGNGHWSMAWSTPSFCSGHYYDRPYNQQDSTSANSGPCTHWDMYGDPAYPAAGDPQMVFIDGKYVHEVAALSDATAGNFFYDWANKVLYLGDDPANHTIELAARPQLVFLNGAGSKVLGVGIRRFATNEYSNATVAAIYAGGANALIENCVFTAMAGEALYANSVQSIVRSDVFAGNGFNGMGSNGHQHSTQAPDGLDIESNVFNGNNIEHYGLNCSVSCATAGIKIAHMDGFTLKNNVLENNIDGHGFWCDLACTKGVIVGNLSRNNGRSGILYEVSDTGIIASNVVYGNANYGIRACSANTKIYNNTVVDNQPSGIWIYDDSRSYGVNGWTDVGPDTKNVELANNVVSGDVTEVRVQGTSLTPPNTTPQQFFSVWNYQSYYRSKGPTQWVVYWIPASGGGSTISYTSLATFTGATGFEASPLADVTSGADPFFVDAANHDYRVRASSAIYQKSTALPADVATAIGVAPNATISPGAVSWPTGP